MNQIIFATLALALATMMSFGQTKSIRHSRERLLDDEVEVMASGVALQVIEHVGSKRFDAAVGDGSVPVTSATALQATFPSGNRCDVTLPIQTTSPYANCDDVEDFHGMAWEELPFVAGADTVRFEVSARVNYVDAATQDTTTTRTFHKRVTVLVRSKADAGGRTMLRMPVRLPRVYSYPD